MGSLSRYEGHQQGPFQVQLSKPVDDPRADARVVHDEHIDLVVVAIGLQVAGDCHRVVAPDAPHDADHRPLPAYDDRLVVAEPRYVAGQNHRTLGLHVAFRGLGCRPQGHHDQVQVFGELAQYRADVHGRIFAPVLLPIRDVLGRDHAGHDVALGLDVGRVEGADLYRLVQVPLRMVRVVESA